MTWQQAQPTQARSRGIWWVLICVALIAGGVIWGLTSATANYQNSEFAPMSATVNQGRINYELSVDDMTDSAYYANAVCGPSDGRELIECLMAGSNQSLPVLANADVVSIEELAELTQELYDGL